MGGLFVDQVVCYACIAASRVHPVSRWHRVGGLEVRALHYYSFFLVCGVYYKESKLYRMCEQFLFIFIPFSVATIISMISCRNT